MRLFEHPDFDQAIIAAQRHFARPGLTEQLIEKDYYVTEALRIVASYLPGKILFKGGTSLSKGWDLIQRFSEDLDLFVNPIAYDPALGRNGIDRELKKLRDAVAAHGGLTLRPEESQTVGGFGRSDRFEYPLRFSGIAAVAPRVLLEVGTSSGTEPTETRSITSYVSAFLRETRATLEAVDEIPFDMPLLHFRRTFVEKMFAIHAKVEMFKESGQAIGSYARHYYDLACLVTRPEVIAMLHSAEYDTIKADYERISLAAFPRGYRRPADMSFANSEALFPPQTLSATLGVEYHRQCRVLCYDAFPAWNDVLAQFAQLRGVL